jgi:tRNA dimethylallyltransferase
MSAAESNLSFHAPVLLAIVGATASGKSALGLRIARELGGEIIVCDSTQVYRGFDIGTSKPTGAEQKGVRHHLIDLLEPDELFTAGAYRDRAIEVLAELQRRACLPVMTVGTGLYMRALIDGFSDTPVRSEEVRTRLRAGVTRQGPDYLHRALKRIDSTAAARIGPRDTPKLMRAIEISLLAGKPVTEVHSAQRRKLEGFRVIKLGLMPPRTALYERIERRTVEMMDRGWLAEVKALSAKGIPPTAKPFSFIGYGELRQHLEGKHKLPACVAAIQQATRRYAKRQLTWFRKEPDVKWFEGFGDDSHLAAEAVKYVAQEIGRGGTGGAV